MKNLKFDINAFVLVEQITGMSIPQLISDESNMERLTVIRALYWAGRIHENSKISLTEAGREMQELVSGGTDMMAISEALSKAIIESGIIPGLEEVEELEAENPPAAPSVKA